MIEGLGYGAAWIGENHVNREIFAHAATLLGCTARIVADPLIQLRRRAPVLTAL